VLQRLEKVIESLSAYPERGSCPKELVALGIRDYRQAFFKPYRTICRIVERRVYVYLIVDGRRKLQVDQKIAGFLLFFEIFRGKMG
jgi:toxin ParE1/3/4